MKLQSKGKQKSELLAVISTSEKDSEIDKLSRMAAYIKEETEKLGLKFPTYVAQMLVASLNEIEK